MQLIQCNLCQGKETMKLNTVLVLFFKKIKHKKKCCESVHKLEYFMQYKHSIFETENSQPEISMAASQVSLNWQQQTQC